MKAGKSTRRKTGHEGFDYYYDEFTSLIQQIEDSLRQQQADDKDAAKKRKRLLHDARDNALPAMSLEARGVSSRRHAALKQDLDDILAACKMQLQTYQTLNEQQSQLLFPQRDKKTDSDGSARSESTTATTTTSSRHSSSSYLFGSRGSTNGNSSDGNSSIQARTQGRVQQQNEQLEAALRSVRESTQVAAEIASELGSQRDTLQGTRTKMGELTSMTKQAKGLVKSMNKPWWQKW